MNFLRRFFRRPQQLWIRRFNFQVHLWAGIILAVYLIVIGVTGSMLVFRAELETLSGTKPWHKIRSKEPFAAVGTVVGNLTTAYPRSHIISVTAPSEEDPTFVAVLQKREQIKVACDASSGAVLGEFPEGAAWITFVLELHERLLIRPNGRMLNAIGGAFLLLLSLTGLVVWWPGVRNWKRALLVDLRRGWRRINFDLHSASGFWTLLIASFWGISGIYFAWPAESVRLIDRFSPVINARPPVIRVTPEAGFDQLDLDRTVERARVVDPGTRWKALAFPFSRRAPLEVTMLRGGGTGREYEDIVYFNPYTGQYLATWKYGDNKSLGDWLVWSQVPLHFGTSWGLSIKIIWAAAGMVIPLLTVTGLLMNWNRVLRRKWKHLRKGAAAEIAVATPAAGLRS
jgi:uncharacterized iron-regulated membrane protein